MSTGPIPSSPKAIAARAGTPPRQNIASAPADAPTQTIAGVGPEPSGSGGVQVTTHRTPATFGTITLINGDDTSG